MDCSGCGSAMRDDARVCLSCGEVVRRKIAPADRLQAVPAGVPHWIALDPPREAETLYYGASRLQRLLAALVDGLILGAVGLLLSILMGGLGATLNDDGTVTFQWARLVVPLLVGAAYFMVFPVTSWQGTPGKKFIGLRIVTLEHEPITLLQSVGRWGAMQVCFGIVFPLAAMVALIGCVAVPVAFLILMGNGRSPWDAMAGTKVVD